MKHSVILGGAAVIAMVSLASAAGTVDLSKVNLAIERIVAEELAKNPEKLINRLTLQLDEKKTNIDQAHLALSAEASVMETAWNTDGQSTLGGSLDLSVLPSNPPTPSFYDAKLSAGVSLNTDSIAMMKYLGKKKLEDNLTDEEKALFGKLANLKDLGDFETFVQSVRDMMARGEPESAEIAKNLRVKSVSLSGVVRTVEISYRNSHPLPVGESYKIVVRDLNIRVTQQGATASVELTLPGVSDESLDEIKVALKQNLSDLLNGDADAMAGAHSAAAQAIQFIISVAKGS